MPDPEYDAFLNRSLRETLTRVLAGDHDRDEVERLLAALPTEEQFPANAEPPMRVLCWASAEPRRFVACDRVRHHLGLHSWESEPADEAQRGELLTADEREAISLAGRLASLSATIVGDGESRHDDLREIIDHVHVIQNAVLAQAAARAYPDTYRLMGESVKGATE